MNRSATSRFRNGDAAFTLVELLVVIVVIAVLAGLMLPAMSLIRARGDSIQCTSNLHQIGIAIGGYVGDNDSTLPGPLSSDGKVLPTYTSSDTTSLAGYLAKYLSLPPATTTQQKAPIFICPAYAKVVPALDQPVYGVGSISTANGTIWPFGQSSGGSLLGSGLQPMRLSALSGLIDGSGKPISTAASIALCDYVAPSGTLDYGWVTYSSKQPWHHDHLNALFYDWHVGAVDAVTMLPK